MSQYNQKNFKIAIIILLLTCTVHIWELIFLRRSGSLKFTKDLEQEVIVQILGQILTWWVPLGLFIFFIIYVIKRGYGQEEKKKVVEKS